MLKLLLEGGEFALLEIVALTESSYFVFVEFVLSLELFVGVGGAEARLSKLGRLL